MTGTLYITRGLPASGKTTWARELIDASPAGAVIRLNRDDLRRMALPTGYTVPIEVPEKVITTVQRAGITKLLTDDVDVIIDDTNLHTRAARQLASIGWNLGADVVFNDSFLAVSLEECLRRNRGRQHIEQVPDHVIERMHARYLAAGPLPPIRPSRPLPSWMRYAPNTDLPPAIIVDIDGTLANHGKRDPYDTTLYHQDTAHPEVVEAVLDHWEMGKEILIVSGRSEEFREVTEEWLNAVAFPESERPDSFEFHLFMRPADQPTTNDAVIKMELFDKHIRDTWWVKWVYDDRNRVVAAWRSIGLKVMQVAEGNF